jgi:DNA repair photolyase
MRWDNLTISEIAGDPQGGAAGRMTIPLFEQGAVVRRFDTPEFRGITFYEVQAKSIINKVPEASHMPFRWTINPYRGCSHSCLYCFARKTHTYLDLDAGEDFNSQIVVKVNAPELLHKELAKKSWRGEHIAMGTNVDPYQRAEGRYKLMRGILQELSDAGNPFSILTKGALILRDIDLLQVAADRTDVGASVSIGSVDRDVWRWLETGTPAPQKRLDVCRTLTDAGIGCGVLMAPIIPFLSDSQEQLTATVKAIAEAGARYLSPIVLHLRPGAREWFMAWLEDQRPDLVPKYERLYRGRSYAPKAYQQEISGRVHDLANRFGIGKAGPRDARNVGHRRPPSKPPPPEQLALL